MVQERYIFVDILCKLNYNKKQLFGCDIMINNLKLFKPLKEYINYQKIVKRNKIKQKNNILLKNQLCERIIGNLQVFSINEDYLDKYKQYIENFMMKNDTEYTIYDFYSKKISYKQKLMYEDRNVFLRIEFINNESGDYTKTDYYDHYDISKILFKTANPNDQELHDELIKMI